MILAMLLAAAATVAAPPPELKPGARYAAAIPTLQQVAGHDFGERISTPEQITAYLRALAAAAPDRTRLVEYARSWEGRPLHVLVVGSPERMARLDAIKGDLRRLGDPRGLSAGEADRLVATLPAVTWLMHAVHGNEISSSDAALAEAYHLLAAQGDADAEVVLRESLVLVDPLQNPDGRARFIAQNELGQAAEPDPDPLSAEHDEPWPGGRGNHYLFDMNRDYFAQSQPETRGRTAVYLEYFPQVVVDLHEMGGESTYYFAPPAEPANPFITDAQRRWFDTFGRANADRFDARGFAYFVREVFDSFYPGYGESWPIFQGAIGMTYEQASARGLVYRRQDDTTFTYRDAVVQHFTAALQTAVTAARGRERLLRDYLEYRRSAAAEGGGREYVIVPGADPSRAERLARLLAGQGIEVRRATGEVRAGTRTVPTGAFLVAAAQPSGRLIRNLLDPAVELEREFVKEQERRRQRRLDDEIYDVTAWSLPLAFDVEVIVSDRPTGARAEALPAGSAPSAAVPAARVAYFMPWGSGTASAVAALLREGVKVRTADEAFTSNGRRFEGGTAIVRVAENGADLAERLARATAAHGVTVVPADSGWVEEGISLGSGRVQVLRAPKVLLAWDRPASSLSAGWARYVLERRFGIPVTTVRTSSLRRLKLGRYDVLVLPSGNYSDALGDEAVRGLRDWMRTGGTLVTLAEASRWAARTKVGLLETRTELKGGRPEVDATDKDDKDKPADKEPRAPFDLDRAIQPEKERPANTAGAFVRVAMDREHWLTAGQDGEITALVEGNRIFTPIKLDEGRNVGLYAAKDRLVASGLMWDEVQAQIAHKAFLVHQPVGDGHLIAFAEDPDFRAYTEATMLLLANAVLLGPGH